MPTGLASIRKKHKAWDKLLPWVLACWNNQLRRLNFTRAGIQSWRHSCGYASTDVRILRAARNYVSLP